MHQQARNEREPSFNTRESTQDTAMYENEAYKEWEGESTSQASGAQYRPPSSTKSARPQSALRRENTVMDQLDESGGCGSCCGIILRICCFFIFFFTLPISLCFCVKVVQEYERAVMFRLGRCLQGAKGPGMFFILPCVEDFVTVDLRTRSFDIPPQEILTRDSVTVSVDAVVYYCVSDPIASVINVADCYSSTVLLAQTTLRTILGTKELREVLSQRDQIAESMLKILDEGTDPWGVKVERVEVKDVRLPKQLQRAMAKEAESQREAHAKVIAADGEKQASMALKEAAMVMSENPSALQLRYLQTLTHIATEKPSTILFPLPLDTLGGAAMQKTKF